MHSKLPSSFDPGLPLLIVVEGENDIHFLTAMSDMLHQADPAIPNLTQLAKDRRIVFMPTCGNNLKDWLSRIASLRKRAFFLFDREQEPETSERRMVIEMINRQPGFFAVMTRKRAVENYLHPMAIEKACGIHLAVDDDTDVARLLTREMTTRSGVRWDQLPSKRQRRLHAKAKKILNVKAIQHMSPALLAEQDLHGEVIGWMKAIQHLVEYPVQLDK